MPVITTTERACNCPRRGQHMAQQRAARQFLQHFGGAAFMRVPLPAAMMTISRGSDVVIPIQKNM